VLLGIGWGAEWVWGGESVNGSGGGWVGERKKNDKEPIKKTWKFLNVTSVKRKPKPPKKEVYNQDRAMKGNRELGSINPKTLGKRKNYTHKLEMYTMAGTREWLKLFETKPANEPGRYEIPADRVAEFNQKIQHLKVTKL